MLMPSIFGENLFDDFFNEFPFYYDDKALRRKRKRSCTEEKLQNRHEDRYQGKTGMVMN